MFIAIIPFCYCYVYIRNSKILVGVDNDGCIQLDFIWSHFFLQNSKLRDQDKGISQTDIS